MVDTTQKWNVPRAAEVVIIGGGFGGVDAARAFAGEQVKVTLIDRRNYNLFVPLLYQVASSQLSPEHIAQPLRRLFRRQKNLTIVFDEAVDIDEANKQVIVAAGEPIHYDYLIIAAGARDAYFGNDQWSEYAWGLKSLEDAERIQQRILLNFELAEVAEDPAERNRLLTYVLVGGGPTGVEMAGAIAELSRYTLTREFKNVDTRHTRVVLLEGMDRILPPFDPELSAAARKSLEKLGVEVHTNAMVTGVDARGVEVNKDERIEAGLVVWAAGIQGASINQGVADVAELDRARRIIVTPELHIPGHPEIFVIGDTAHIPGPEGRPLPGVAQVAQQGGKHAAVNILHGIAGEPYEPFVYKDYGSMATIGRNSAVASIGGMKFSGYPAWAVWAFIHILRLINFRNKIYVFFKWMWDYVDYNRSGRLIRNYSHPHHTVEQSKSQE
ncbi:MAG: NAD(P)/FAD-dependent oxidoreductase [Thermomicrobiales bacterium]|nr:NAD(P)/FAD-dependent oxidoreductase [Thermomicrobiales bacterium]MCO5217467.1 NAD(P)/FAD-dependent oxidoreductase [Thermomicrobiales bacterium]MCO5223948.1 NAD(P)/FAD-dependent oxidoreductase [Thermomicrobiales bacterium]MCO5226762.1 NAD(P)/FAD-dependent oxidoreductase [Thermomicrobiales bacterium]